MLLHGRRPRRDDRGVQRHSEPAPAQERDDDERRPRLLQSRSRLRKEGRDERAIKDFSEAITLDPSDPDSFRSRGSAYDDQERYDLALSDYEQSLKLDPKNALTLIDRGVTFSNTGEPEKAIKDFDAAIVLDPKRGRTYYSRALAYEKTADPVRAQADLETAARLDPDDEDVQAALKRVRALVQARPTASAPGPAAANAPASGSSAPGGPATLADLEAQENATAAVWERLPFSTRHAMFVVRKASAYGDYDARPSNVFAPGEKLLSLPGAARLRLGPARRWLPVRRERRFRDPVEGRRDPRRPEGDPEAGVREPLPQP